MIPVRYDINCDLGEGESAATTRALMLHITSANIACGGHTGSLRSMERAVRAAVAAGVHIGAHPGLIDPIHFGRAAARISAVAFETLLVHQIAALEKIVKNEGARLHHVKLHGALYHLTDSNAAFREAFISVMQRFWPRVIVFARAGGKTATAAAAAGLHAWPEGFLDRKYLANGKLAPRGGGGAVLNQEKFMERVVHLAEGGSPVRASVRTWCIHSDTPHAIEFAYLAKKWLSRKPTKRK
jgi:5-oxoprolinase (ATP-hydrolysing) subunit A